MKAVIYARYSSDNQREESIEGQLRECTAFAQIFLHRFRKLDMTRQSHRKMLIDTFVNAIFLYDDKLMLGLNFHEGTVTITFDDLQKAIENEGFGSDLNSVGAPYQSSEPIFQPEDRFG